MNNLKKFFVALRDYLKKSDSLLLVLCLSSAIFGTVLIYSAIRHENSSGPVYVQIGAIIIGLLLYFVFSIIDVDIISGHWKLLTFLGLLFILSLRWIGVERNGNRAWIRFAGIGIQPAEVVKIIFIVTIATLIVYFKEERKLNHPLSVLALLLIFGTNFGLIIFISKDMGSALVYAFIFVIMLYTAGIKWYWILGAVAALIAAAPYIWAGLSENQQQRILAPYTPSIDPNGKGILWQTNLSKAALASGRLFGMGLFRGSHTQAGAVPFQQTDFIFAVVGEELGMVGCIVVISLLIAIIVRCVQVGLRSQSHLGALVCIGIAAMLAFQTFENIGMCIGVAPVIGLTLPFFSYGGSSIVTTFAAMGIVSGVKMKPKPTMFIKW